MVQKIIKLVVLVCCINLFSVSAQTEELHKHPLIVKMWTESNLQRARKGLAPHRIDPILCKMAQDHANFMARTGQFSHYVNGGLIGRARKYGWKSGYVMENIAEGQIDIKDAFRSWMNSAGHRSAILSHTTKAGFGAQRNHRGQWFWVSIYSN